MIFEATEVTSAEHTQSTRKVGAPSVSYEKDKQGSSLVLNHYCLLTPPFNLHPWKSFEGYRVKSALFFSGWQKHLRFSRVAT